MKYLSTKNQLTFVSKCGFLIALCLIFFYGGNQLSAQDWQPEIDYSEVDNIDYGNSYNTTPLPDEPVRLSERLIGQRISSQNRYNSQIESAAVETQSPPSYRAVNKNRVVHAAYNNIQTANKTIPQNYETEINTRNIPTTPQKLTPAKTSTAAMTAAIKPKTLPKHISRNFNTNFDVDAALEDYSDLPLDNNIIVRRPLKGNTIQVSGVSDCNNCITDSETDDSGVVYADSCGEQTFDCGYCSPMMMKPFGAGILDNLTIFGGTTGFKAGQLDGNFGDNFGFTEGLNWSAPVSIQYCTLSTQLGFRAIHSNLKGSFAHEIGIAEKNRRTQYFITAGIFKRSLTSPIQAGAVFDYFEDDFYNKINLTQIRFELSVRTFSNLEYGFIGGFGLESDSNAKIDIRENYLRYRSQANGYQYKIKSQQYYTLFARKYFATGNLGEFRIGATEHGNVFLAANGEFPVNDRVALNGSFTTMIPNGSNGWNRETWDLSIGLVIYFRGGAMTKICNENRPMFDVAQNGSFLTRITRK
ncbi:MAG: hypothetical protein LBC74_07005 [Planctomycetaceae bacterium]|jgi:hypothetical protein|nr:hypothetical protein [Planctomycetaceae bacterium]